MSTPIIILAGQSNANRPNVSLAIAEYASENGALFVNFAVSGTPLSVDLDRGYGDWSGSTNVGAGELRMELEDRIDALVDPNSPAYVKGAYVAGVVWIQGEGDLKNLATASAYSANLLQLHDYFIDKYGQHEWVVSALSALSWEGRTGTAAAEDLWLTVRNGQLALDGVDGITVVDPDVIASLNGVLPENMFIDDRIHYDEAFQSVLARALAEVLVVEGGDGILQIGTTQMDNLVIRGGVFTQVYGAGGSDTADFSQIGHGINVEIYSDKYAQVTARHGDQNFSANLNEIEKIRGTDFDDLVNSGPNTRVIYAEGGDDKVVGTDANEVFSLGTGDDKGFGGKGDDFIRGSDGNDQIQGGDGNDRLWGEKGDDRIQGGNGDDYILGGDGDDRIDPQGGADTIAYRRGDSGVDTINGFDDRFDLISFEGLDLDEECIEFSTSGRDFYISVHDDDANVHVDITLLNRANIAPEFYDSSVDWIML